MMNPIRSIVQAELEKSREEDRRRARRKRSSKKKRAAGIGAGAITGGMMGVPVGLAGALAMGLGKKKIKIKPPKGVVAQVRYFRRGGGFEKDLSKGLKKAQREAMIGLGAGASGGALIGGLAGHEISKHAAQAVSSRITPQSSSVRGFSYDPKSQSMLVTFKNGGTYRYKGVPPNVAKAMGRNKSVGKTVHRSIKQGGYQYEKVAKKSETPSASKWLQSTKAEARKRGYSLFAVVEDPKHPHGGGSVTSIRPGHEGDAIRNARKAHAKWEKKHGYDPDHDWSKTAKQKSYKCKFCKEPATKGVIWAEGKGIVPCCDKHLAKGKVSIDDPKDIDLIRDLTKQSSMVKQAGGGYTLSEWTKKGDDKSDRDVQRIDVHHKGKNVGFQTYHPGSDGDYVWVKSLYVDPKHRGKGVAKMLLDEVERKNKGKELRLRARPFRDKSVSADSLKEIYKKRGYVQYDEDNRMVKTAEEEIGPLEPLPEETPISERVFQNLTMQAKTPQEENATQADLVMDKMAQCRRQIAKLAGAAKKQVTWQGLTMKLEYLDGEERSGVSKEGKKWSRTMKGSYGYMPGTYGKGADGEAIDVYLSPKAGDEVAKSVYKIRQLRKDDGKFDEDKFMVGYASADDAKKAFLSNMPKWAFGDITEMSMDSFKTLVGQDQRKRKTS